MKKNVWIMTLLLIVSGFSVKLTAQENLDALVKKCATMESVDVDIMGSRNPETQKMEKKVIGISFCKNPTLLNEFVAAFKKDEEKAISMDERQRGGQIFNLLYKFEHVTYFLSQNDKECISIKVLTSSTTDTQKAVQTEKNLPK